MEFGNLGKHCSEPTCKQQDFLPFNCKYCQKQYCLDHRDEKSHACPNANVGDTQIFFCPVCSKSVRFDAGRVSADEYWSIHAATECQPINSSSVNNAKTKTRVCEATGCRAQLTTVNAHMCKKCKKELCLKHRFEDQHECGYQQYPKNRNLGTGNKVVTGTAMPQNNKPVSVVTMVSSQPVSLATNYAEICSVCGMKFCNVEQLIQHAEKVHC